jgi:hypothetical protein
MRGPFARRLTPGVTMLQPKAVRQGVPPIVTAAPTPDFDLPSYQALPVQAGTPEALRQRLAGSVERWSVVARALNLRSD